ncbi:MAG: hypothetical protein EA343_08655 [Nodularia sp. (in: Bacteria)]|nr:MAG: hypothetical protein EA343_08655 [Nodularia sp. (in: cyanobacteria)]
MQQAHITANNGRSGSVPQLSASADSRIRHKTLGNKSRATSRLVLFKGWRTDLTPLLVRDKTEKWKDTAEAGLETTA